MKLCLTLVAAATAFIGASLTQAAPIPNTLIQTRSAVTNPAAVEVFEALTSHAGSPHAVRVPGLTNKAQEIQLVARASVPAAADQVRAFLDEAGRFSYKIRGVADASTDWYRTYYIPWRFGPRKFTKASYDEQLEQTEYGTRFSFLHAKRMADRSLEAYADHASSKPSKWRFLRRLAWKRKHSAAVKQAYNDRQAFYDMTRTYFEDLNKLSDMHPTKHPRVILDTYAKFIAARERHIARGGLPRDFDEPFVVTVHY